MSLKNQVLNDRKFSQVSLELVYPQVSVYYCFFYIMFNLSSVLFFCTEDRLKHKVLGKQEVFYGGQLFSGKIVAPPASKVNLLNKYLIWRPIMTIIISHY